jgi:Na+-translocating ferredoxin:NAD+ oxidoreductase RnfC subunit
MREVIVLQNDDVINVVPYILSCLSYFVAECHQCGRCTVDSPFAAPLNSSGRSYTNISTDTRQEIRSTHYRVSDKKILDVGKYNRDGLCV